MPASPDPLVEYVVALCGRAPWGMSHRQVARICGVSEAALCRWLAVDPAQHRNPSPRNAAVLRAVIARLEADR